MNEFDQQLREALARKPAPPDLAARIGARLPATRRPAPWRTWAVGLAATLVMTVGGVRYHQYRQGMEAREQLLRALEITERKLALVESKLQGRHQ